MNVIKILLNVIKQSSELFGRGIKLFIAADVSAVPLTAFTTVLWLLTLISVLMFSSILALKTAVKGTAEKSATMNSFRPRPNRPEDNNVITLTPAV